MYYISDNKFYQFDRKKKRRTNELDSSSSSISMVAIQDVIERLKRNRFRSATRDAYYGIWKNFNKFFIKLDIKPPSWEDRIALYAGFLIDHDKKSTTVKSYVSAIKAVLRDDGIIVNEDRYLLTSLTKACKIVKDKVRIHLPIQRGLLDFILIEVGDLYDRKGQPYHKTLYQALFSTTYYGLFHVSEVTMTCSQHAVAARNVQVADNKKKMLFMLETSKTHGRSVKPQIIKISSTEINWKEDNDNVNTWCPYSLLQSYLSVRRTFSTNREPFFIFNDRSPVTDGHARRVLKKVLKGIGLQQNLYNFQSFRQRRAVDLLQLVRNCEEDWQMAIQ